MSINVSETTVKCFLIGAQVVIVIVLGILVALGRDSAITDALLAISGSLVGSSVFSGIKGAIKLPGIQPRDITDAGDDT